MATLDTPIQEPVRDLDVPIEDTSINSGTSEALDNFKALQAAYLENYSTGKPVVDSYLELRGSPNLDAEVADKATQKINLDTKATVEVLEELSATDPEVFTESVDVAGALIEEKKQAIAKLDPDTQFVDAIAGPDATEEQKAAVATNIKLWSMLNEQSEEFGFGELLMDFGLELLPFVSTAGEVSLTGDVLNNKDRIENAIFNFKKKPLEEQEKLFPALMEEVIDSLGPIRGLDTLKKFIDPVGDDELGDFSNWWKVIDAVDIASLGTIGALQIGKLSGSFNLPKTMKKLDNEEGAGNAVAAALADDGAAEAMNMTRETAASDAMPFDVSIEDPAYTSGLATASQNSIKNFFYKADATVTDIMQGNGYLKEGVLHTAERAAKEKIAMERLSNTKAENVKISGSTENTTTFTYQARDEDGNLYDDEFILDLTLNDVGQYEQSEIMTTSGFLSSPTVWAKSSARRDADIAQRLDNQTAKVFKELTKLQTEAIKPLGNLLLPKNRAKMRKVEEALKAGDEWKNADGTRGIVFEPDHPSLAGFDDGMLEAYYNTNRLYNNLWRLRNHSKREEMIAFGFKRAQLLDEEYSFGKPFDTDGAAMQALIRGKATTVFDAVADQVISNVTKAKLEESYALGKKLVKLEENYSAGAGRGRFTYVLVDAEGISELPSTVLSRKVGYVPKISENGYWFVKEFGEELVNGSPQSVMLKTHRYFDNKEEAVKFRDQLRQKAIDEENLTEVQAANRFKELEDREQEIISTATGTFSHGSGGLYTGARAEDSVLFGLNGEQAQRINPYEALVRNIANVSRMVPINQWRLGLEQRWLNTANQLLDTPIEKFGALPETIESTRAGEFLNKMAKQIRDWQGFPSTEEQIYNSLNQRLYEWALRTDRNKTAKLVGWMRDKDPISGARAAAFHSLLGWFNPAQLWVQAQGMSVAVSISLGKNLTETLKHTTGLTVLGLGEDIPKGRFKTAAKVAGMDVEEFTEMHRLWKQSGLEDSILQTADHAAAIRGHGIAMDAISKAADKGLFFYRHGELLNRRMAFTVALDELKKGKLKGWEDFSGKVGDDALKAVLDRTNNLTLNMSKAARAQWQKGITSLPTQFFGITARTLETVGGFNDNLTKAERLRVLAGQVALYGTAGIPLASLGTQYLMQTAGVTQEDIDENPVLVKTFNDGFWGFTTLGIFGVDIEMSARGSLLRGVTDFIDNWMFSESTVAEKLMGAFGATGQRFWDSFTHQMKPLMFGAVPIDAIDVAKMPVMPFLDTVSTWRNGEKAVFMQMIDKIMTSKGQALVERPFDIRESIAKAIGFSLSDENKPYSLEERTRHVVQYRTKVADMIIGMMNDAIIKSESGLWSDEKQAQLEQNYAAIYGSLDWADKVAVRKAVKNRLMGKSKEALAINRYIRTVGTNTTDGISAIQGLFGTKIQTVQEEE